MRRKWRLGVAAALLAGGVSLALPFGARADEKGIAINETNFPDEYFREFVEDFDTKGDGYYYNINDDHVEYNPEDPDFNPEDWQYLEEPDGYLDEEEIAEITEIDSEKYYRLKWVETLKGIEYLTEVKYLNVESIYYMRFGFDDKPDGRLEDIDLSKNTKLEYLDISGQGKIASLDLSNNPSLKELHCEICEELSAIDFGNNKGFESIDLLRCPFSTSINVSEFSALKSLTVDCLYNVDLSQNTELESLKCGRYSSQNISIYRGRPTVSYVLDLRNNTKLNYVSVCSYYDGETTYDLEHVWMPEKTTIDVDNPPYIMISGPDIVDLRMFNTDAGGEETVDCRIAVKSDADLGWVDGTRDPFYGYEKKRYVEETGETPDTLRFATGLREIDGKKYYFDEECTAVVNDIVLIDGVERYFDKDGVMQDALPENLVVGSYYFPDKNFRGWAFTKADKNRDGFLTEAECAAVTKFQGYFTGVGANGGGDGYTEVYDGWDIGITYEDFKGIEYFPNLKIFSYYNNAPGGGEYDGNWKKLELSGNTKLEEVYISGQISLKNGIDISKCSALRSLVLQTDDLAQLDVSGCPNLEWLDIGRSDVGICCGKSNCVTELNLSKNTKLQFLDISFNPISVVDVSNLSALKEFHCEAIGMAYDSTAGCSLGVGVKGKGTLTSLDVSKNKNLEYLWCNLNQLTSLDLKNNTKLKGLACGYNALTSLNISGKANLEYLNCYGNKITKLNVAGTKLTKAETAHEAALMRFGSNGGVEIKYGEEGFYNGEPFPTYYEKKADGSYAEDKNGNWIKKTYQLNVDKNVEVTGKIVTGWLKTSAGMKYADQNGKYVTGLQTIENKKYYFNASGIMQTGLQNVKGKTYGFGSNGVMLTGRQKVGKKYYYFSPAKKTLGQMQTGKIKVGKYYYYFSPAKKTLGQMQTGKIKVGKYYYYFSPAKKTLGQMQTGKIKIGKNYYYFSPAKKTLGQMQTGKIKIGKKYYYFSPKKKSLGQMKTGWVKIGKKKYYFSPKKKTLGQMTIGKLKIGKKTYKFNKNGICLNP